MTKMFCDKCGKSVPNDFYDKVEIAGRATGLGNEGRYTLCIDCSYQVKEFIEKDSKVYEVRIRRKKRQLKELLFFLCGVSLLLVSILWFAYSLLNK